MTCANDIVDDAQDSVHFDLVHRRLVVRDHESKMIDPQCQVLTLGLLGGPELFVGQLVELADEHAEKVVHPLHAPEGGRPLIGGNIA